MKRNIYTALATTAAVAVLAGAAHAQMSGAPQVCTSTNMNPGHNDCVMPTASAQGGGSFPGSFLVPGTNTSFAVHGFIRFDIVHDFGPHQGVNSFGAALVPLDGSAAHSLNGGTELQAVTTRPNIETRTPTAYGELKTYIEFDFNENSGLSQQGTSSTSALNISGNNDLIRLRQAYGTLGPWLIGQAFSMFADAQSYSDVAAGLQDVGMMNTLNVRRPQMRYTWLAGQGLSIAGSIEQPTYVSNIPFSSATGTGGGLTGGPVFGTSTTFGNWPAFVGAGEWDQPWGHLKFATGVEINDVRSDGGISSTGAATPVTNHQTDGVAMRLTGHLNTVGKDALRGGIVYNDGAANFSSDMTQGGELYNTTSGARTAIKEWAGYASYEHFFNGQWRANATGGYAHFSGNPGFTGATLGSLNREMYDTNVNIIYSPVPQTDFYLEWQHIYRKVVSSNDGVDDRIDAQFNFYF
ncbi:MAG: DcaP family trimeric outer membrane transporter [Stellaceae bacterium]